MGHSIEHHEHMGSLTFIQIADQARGIEDRIVTYTHSIPRYMRDGYMQMDKIKRDPLVQFLCAKHAELVQRAVSIRREIIIR